MNLDVTLTDFLSSLTFSWVAEQTPSWFKSPKARPQTGLLSDMHCRLSVTTQASPSYPVVTNAVTPVDVLHDIFIERIQEALSKSRLLSGMPDPGGSNGKESV